MVFVETANGDGRARGVGKLVQRRGGNVRIEYFDLPMQVAPLSFWVPAAEVRGKVLEPQTRVFVRTENHDWCVGRVLNGEGERLLLQLPNSQPRLVDAEHIFVRWAVPISDPISFLSQKITETPLFADARSDFLAAVTAQRVSCQGVGALLSSAIELTAYQFEVVRRILQDPVQRYLLADEVGLGKTVEAGILIRQYFLDEPVTARALVVVPSALVGQWRQELEQRFFLGDLLDDFLHVVPADDTDGIRELIGDVGMLVVDEAHHLSSLDASSNVLYEILRRYALRIPRLLLLSATPALVDEAGFLRMIHLLDPVIFPLDDIDGFRRRINARQKVAETVGALIPENMLILPEYLDRFVASFPDDTLLNGHVQALQKILDGFPDYADKDYLRALAVLRTYLSETYRLHRRIMRNRRRSVPSWVTPERTGVEVWDYACPATAHFGTTVESVRLAVGNSAASIDGHLARLLFDAAINPELPQTIERLLSYASPAYPAFGAALGELAQAAQTVRRRGARITRLVDGLDELLKDRCHVVVFCTEERVADDVFERLVDEFGKQVVRHTPEFDEEGGVTEWHRFHTDAECRIVVCDRRAEEGLNLHGGRKVVVNFDIPASPNTIEQRLGRLDRFGAGDDVRSFILACTDHSIDQAWISCLDTGFGVFSQSIASLQYLVDSMLRDLPVRWLDQALRYIETLTSELQGPDGLVKREMRRIDHQDRLDSLDSEGAGDDFATLEDADEDWQSFGAVADRFAFQSLQFRKRPVSVAAKPVPGDQPFRVEYAYNRSQETLITIDEFVTYFQREIDRGAPGASWKSPLLYPYSYRRNTVLTAEARRQDMRLLRYGSGFIDALSQFVDHDDRGRAFAMWRYRPGSPTFNDSGVDLHFRFDFLIEASIEAVEDVMKETDQVHAAVGMRAVRRVADGVMAPRFVRVWLDDQLRLVQKAPDELLDTYSNRASDADGKRDFNLNPRRWAMLQSAGFEPANWAELCQKAREMAEVLLLQQNEFREHIEASKERMSQVHALKQGQFEARIARLSGDARRAEQAELALQDAVDNALMCGIDTPIVRLDSVGAIFLSSRDPFGGV
jgi:ATP-dependent helicase HepA